MDAFRHATRAPVTSDHGEAGFTIVELMMAMLILVVGLIGTFALFDGAQKTTRMNNARIGAVNLARQITESARAVDYDADLRPAAGAGTGIGAALQAKPGLAGTGNPWSVVRRGVTYQTQVSVCTFDDPKDGLATSPTPPPDNACTPAASAITGAPTESNPDDFRRVTVQLTWVRDGQNRTLTQTALIANPSGGLGPRILTFPQPASQITSGNQLVANLTTTRANNLHWTVDSVGTDGDAAATPTGSKTAWTLTWPIGNVTGGAYAPGAVVDGTYSVDAQAFSDVGIPGETRSIAVAINRMVPLAPTNAAAGRNQRYGGSDGVVDLEWRATAERDILGYRVYRVTAAGRTRVCPDTGPSTDLIKTVFCTDRNPPASGSITYEIQAVDLTNLADANSAQREGAAATVTVDAAGAVPEAPTGLNVTIVDGAPTLTWTQPAGAPVNFYRIYRDAGGSPGIGDRYDATLSNALSYVDSGASPGTHTYWVTAVGSTFNESGFSAPKSTP